MVKGDFGKTSKSHEIFLIPNFNLTENFKKVKSEGVWGELDPKIVSGDNSSHNSGDNSSETIVRNSSQTNSSFHVK